ncbi:DUF5080 family protein [Staphylococcus debuckii]|uniref:DUF5080 family protein n=1 Tax=Staphylococcus debuckii TaxID=2044912 RepID=UPI000F4374D3|nr:DUF5080 family protein [Staphylococcus debuckii]AYU53982.1 DUF5080 family protein [Staphylococcus debuckii]
MTYLLLFLMAGLYYVVYITSVMYAEGIKLLQWIAYGISAVIFLITFFFVNPSFSSLQNYIFVLTLGFVVYGWLAIKSFWTRPYQVKIESMEPNPNHSLTKEKYEEIESMQINLASEKYKGVISGIISVICMVAIKLKLTSILKEDLAGGLFTIGLILSLMIIIYFIIDIILVIRRRRFSFITLRPLGTLILLIFFSIII